MKILPSVVLSFILSSYLSQAFRTVPQSPVALSQDAEISNKSSDEKKSIFVPLNPRWNGTRWDYKADMYIGTPENPETQNKYPMTMGLNSVNTSIFTDACSLYEDTVWNCSTKEPYVPQSSKDFKNDTDNVVMSTTNFSKVLGYTGTDKMGFSNTEEAKVSSRILFRVNASLQTGFTGLISLSPNKNSFLEVLKNSSQITEQEFMFTTDAIDQISGIKFGDIPGITKDTPWFPISKEKWQIKANYVAIGGKKGQDCNAINWEGVALFTESPKIILPSEAYNMLHTNFQGIKDPIDGLVRYKCSPDALKTYPNISIYTSEYKIDIPAKAYMDFNNMNASYYCPLAVDFLNNTKSCITLGYYFFGYSQVVFSKDRQEIGLLRKNNLTELTVFPFENKTGIAAIILLVVVFGFVFVRSSQKEEELRIDIDNTPRQVRSESYYEYSYSE